MCINVRSFAKYCTLNLTIPPLRNLQVFMAHVLIDAYTPTSTTASGSKETSSPSTSASLPHMKAKYAYLDDESLLCDWQLIATSCREEHITRMILIVSSVQHFLIAVYAICLIIERNGGVDRKIFTGLFTKVGNRVQPRPVRAGLCERVCQIQRAAHVELTGCGWVFISVCCYINQHRHTGYFSVSHCVVVQSRYTT